ncbi:hypothetical protein SISSUDRAFT_1128020 [Sistotremastrum suecicum HHB10207 ss-3]|uniref:Uncharacterized protein n=1 Tax=Sistotremastrum suecicum HHB10207 ss-3 TaxID=1314776 RepID=A0A166EEW8_9AGAM|nr:hypothetical protein SISSUDRAFT_1128020 [Sistotremastrum suecicum HHB10207 ss-3]
MGRPRAKKAKTLRQATNHDKSSPPDATVSETSMSRDYNPPLPQEIVAMIVRAVADGFDEDEEDQAGQIRRQMCILARSSRQLQVEAERRLYRTVKFTVGEINAQKLAAILRRPTIPSCWLRPKSSHRKLWGCAASRKNT